MKVGDLIRRKVLNGCLFGVEVEVEGVGLPEHVDAFKVVREGSLRPVDGEQGKEYVFARPYPLEKSLACLEALREELNLSRFVQFSERTSIHVHVNVTDLTMNEWFTFLFLWVLFEEAMIDYCGEERKGNLFCLSSRDAEGLVFTLDRCAREGHIQYLDDEVRYSAINTAATNKYGSLEFRSMRGTMDMDVLTCWLTTLASLRKAAQEFGSPAVLIDKALNDEEFIHKLFPEGHFIREFKDINRIVMENAFRCALIVDTCDFSRFTFFEEPNIDI